MNLQHDTALPAVLVHAERDIAEMTAEIKPLAKEYKDLKKRIDGMAIFRDRTVESGRTKRRSDVEFHSSPEEELFYEHRRHYEEAEKEKGKLKEDMARMTPGPDDIKDFNQIVRTLRAMEVDGKQHLEHMRKILSDLRARMEDVEAKMIGMVQERARLVNQMIQHKDKMEIAREGGKEPTSEELVAKMAAKHGVSVAEVQELLNAKSVHVDP